MLLAGGEGKNTVKGGDGADVLIGGGKATSCLNEGADRITADVGLKDTVDGGAGNDTIVFSTNLNSLDSVVVGDGDDKHVQGCQQARRTNARERR